MKLSKSPIMIFQKTLQIIAFIFRIFAVVLPVSFGAFWLLDFLFSAFSYESEVLYWIVCISVIFLTYRFLWTQIIWFTGLNKIIELES